MCKRRPTKKKTGLTKKNSSKLSKMTMARNLSTLILKKKISLMRMFTSALLNNWKASTVTSESLAQKIVPHF